MSTENNAANAIAEVMAHTPNSGVPKDARNDFARYDYVSADALYAIIRGPVARAGLSVWQDEETFEIISTDGGITVRVTYLIGFTTSTDGRPSNPERVTIIQKVSNTQNFAGLRTFALKYWLRGRLLMPLGEHMDEVDATDGSLQSEGGAKKEEPPVRIEKNGGLFMNDGRHLDDDIGIQRRMAKAMMDILKSGTIVKRDGVVLDVDARRVIAGQYAWGELQTHNMNWIKNLPQTGRDKIIQMFKERIETEPIKKETEKVEGQLQ